jgi:hypothetical protein
MSANSILVPFSSCVPQNPGASFKRLASLSSTTSIPEKGRKVMLLRLQPCIGRSFACLAYKKERERPSPRGRRSESDSVTFTAFRALKKNWSI